MQRNNVGDAVFWSLIGLLAICSLFFALQVEVRRGDWKTQAAAGRIESKTLATVVGVLDGDEIAVEQNGEITVVRLLGVKSLGGATNEPGISSFAAASRSMLQKQVLNERISIDYDTYQVDSRNRLLAYIHSGAQDIGQLLIEEGLALSYVRYPFSRQAEYSVAEAAARSQNKGLWGHPKASARAVALSVAWKAQAEDGE